MCRVLVACTAPGPRILTAHLLIRRVISVPSDPVVWIVGAKGDNRLHGFRGDTGDLLLPAGAGPLWRAFVISKP
jgi:hypothetical protein